MWPFTRNATVDDVNALSFQLTQIRRLIERLTANMARTFEEVLEDLDTLTTTAADRINAQNALIAQLQEAVASGDQRQAEALAAQLSEHVAAMEVVADRLRDVAIDPDDVVPDPSPLPEVPAPSDPGGETPPAEEPAAPAEEDAGTVEEGTDSNADDDGFAQGRNF